MKKLALALCFVLLLAAPAGAQQGPSPGNITTPLASDFVPLYGRGTNGPLFGQIAGINNPIGGVTVSGPAAAGYVPVATSSSAAAWGTFTNPLIPFSNAYLLGSTLTAFLQNGTAVSSTVPETGGQFYLTSNVGIANPTTAFKIALWTGATCGSSSAACYGFNSVVSGYGGGSYGGLYSNEADVNNFGSNAETLGALNGVYGYMALTGGTAISTVGFRAAAAASASAWYYGHSCDGYIAEDCFTDQSNSVHVLTALNTHTAGIDFSTATFSSSVAMLVGNSHHFDGKLTSGAGGGLVNMMIVDGSNVLELGDPLLTFIQANQSLIPSTNNTYVLGDSSFLWAELHVQNIYTSGTLGLTPATWTDTQTCTAGQISVDASYIYVCTATNTVKRAALTTF